MTLNPNGAFTNEKSEQQLTADIFKHIRETLERDGDKAEILFNAIQLRKLLACEPPGFWDVVLDNKGYVKGVAMNTGETVTPEDYNWSHDEPAVPPYQQVNPSRYLPTTITVDGVTMTPAEYMEKYPNGR